MKKNLITIVLIIILFFSSCNLIDIEPVSEIPSKEMWKTPRDARAGVTDIYGLFRNTMRDGYFYWGEFRADNFVRGTSLSTDQQEVIDNVITSSHPSTQWDKLYRMINQTNLAIKYLPEAEINSVEEKNDLLAQAYAMRALGYFYAVRVWGDVPLYTEPNEVFDESLYRGRTDKEHILRNTILEDLKKAELLSSFTINKERKRISIFGIRAIMADVYMWLKEYSLADQIIDKMKSQPNFLTIEPDVASWSRLFTDELVNKVSDYAPATDEYSSKELIFVIHFNMSEVGAYGFSRVYSWFYGTFGNRMASISENYLESFDPGDFRRNYLLHYEGTDLRFIKYSKGLISPTLNNVCEVGYPIYRMTDMILLQAEAKANLGKWGEALELVRPIRSRAGLSTPSSTYFTSTDQLINFILKERQTELVGEGRRWFDLLRTNKWREVMEPINGMKDEGNQFFPIYFQHIDDNPLLKQNPYYGS